MRLFHQLTFGGGDVLVAVYHLVREVRDGFLGAGHRQAQAFEGYVEVIGVDGRFGMIHFKSFADIPIVGLMGRRGHSRERPW